ncbi:50S ribosomal protein L34e [Candidatus Woesearchaeota archaeon CG10_big_fil_rev_8_21_14_0_10_44_13]|nr:MAG: 50S ribosomal protein L34e [Candidatus Woesearchaeota archaeon CG10_big_fil_rev_8_21_14_0_10_44_13]
MPAGRYRSRTLRRVYKRTPGNKVKLVYKKRKPSKAQCAGCGSDLKGTFRGRVPVMMNLPKTKKRPERPYGGVLCSRCARRKIILASRQ